MVSSRHREDFIAQMAKAGASTDTARRILRVTATIDRLAVAMCNGDWPADNGERKVAECPRCARLWDPSTIKAKGCDDCRAEDRAKAIVAELPGWAVETSGDPRGCVVKLKTPDGRELGVPS